MDKVLSTSNSDTFKFRLGSTLTGLLVILALFIIGEVGVRFFFTPCFLPVTIYKRFDPAQLSYGFDENAPVFHQCGSETIFLGSEKTAIYRYKTTKASNEIRIFTLGGSVSFTPVNDNYSVYLSKVLHNQTESPEHYQVINTSTRGYGSSRMLVLFKQILETNQKPDLVIIHPHGSNEFEDEVQLAYLNEIRSKWYNQILSKSKFFLVMKRLNQWITPEVFAKQTGEEEIEASKDPKRVARWQHTYNENLVEMCNLANTANVPIILLLRAMNPTLTNDNTFADERTLRLNNETYRDVAGCNNIHILDTPKILEQHYPNPSADIIDDLFIDTSHWRAKTHEIIATHILKLIEKTNLKTARMN